MYVVLTSQSDWSTKGSERTRIPEWSSGKSRFALSSLSWQSCWKIARFKKPRVRIRAGTTLPLRPTERHSFRCFHCPIDSRTNHALALLLVIDTEATIAANINSKAFDFVDSLHKY